ncbi:WG repeat-containing protein [Phnomibacter sp. MR]|uniref:WG repeat-containing protein n=1 Tax=Phnomibacter sp. MR TaxID=3042318 RepID=UPI003A7FC68D
MKLIFFIGLIAIVTVGLFACESQPKEKSDKESFEDILNDPSVNTKEVGEREGIKYFQVEKDGKTGFRDLDGNIVIEPKFDMAEMFSEGLSAVEVNKKWGYIDTTGKYVLQPKYEYAGSFHNGLASFRANDKYGFINRQWQETIRPQFAWVDEFSEGLCVVRNDNGKHGYIDTTGKLVVDFEFQYANKFENGRAKVEINNLWGAIDKKGKVIEPAKHKYASDW